MKRVLIGAQVFKISATGFDVSTASPAQIIFDAFAGVPYNGVYMAGLVPNSAMQYRDAYSFQYTVNFGKQFAAPPGCIVRPISTHTAHALTNSYGANTVQGRSVTVYVTITTTTLNVIVTGSGFSTQIGFAYLAMQV